MEVRGKKGYGEGGQKRDAREGTGEKAKGRRRRANE